jgi:hypothetical protein
MINKKLGYAQNRPFYAVDPNVNIMAGMVAFLGTSGGTTVATTAASGTIPIGCFWKDRSASYVRSSVESKTFNAAGIITLNGGNVISTATIKVTNAAGTVTYTQGLDYSVNTVNGVVTNLGVGIAALATVVVWYNFTQAMNQVNWFNASTQFSSGQNYDRQPDDTLGSGKITIAEGWAHIYTDMYDVNQTYILNDHLQSDANSLWTTAVGVTSACGRVIKVPTASDPFLGVCQIPVVV